MENKEESEGAFVEGTANADLLDANSHLIMPGGMIRMRAKNDSHHNVNRTKLLSELQGRLVILKRDDPHVQRQ